jgi:hypothetical protein
MDSGQQKESDLTLTLLKVIKLTIQYQPFYSLQPPARWFVLALEELLKVQAAVLAVPTVCMLWPYQIDIERPSCSKHRLSWTATLSHHLAFGAHILSLAPQDTQPAHRRHHHSTSHLRSSQAINWMRERGGVIITKGRENVWVSERKKEVKRWSEKREREWALKHQMALSVSIIPDSFPQCLWTWP